MKVPRDFGQIPPRRHWGDPLEGPFRHTTLDSPLARLVCAVALVIWMYVLAAWLGG